MLNPVFARRMTPTRCKDIEKQLVAIFYDILFRPIVDIVKDANPAMAKSVQINNAAGTPGALEKALRLGRIQYSAGIFSGQFSAAISKDLSGLGGHWDSRSSTYRMEPSQVPGWIRAIAADYHHNAAAAHDQIKQTLDQIMRDLPQEVSKRPVKAKKMVRQVESDFKPSADALRVSPALSEEAADRLAEGYSDNMSLWIKKFSEEMIGQLRDIVERNATAGYRFDTLVDQIKMRYSVTQSKAEFLARNETQLFTAKFQQARFKDAGVTMYKWSTSHDERVRPAPGVTGRAALDNHRKLDGRIFSFDDPPVVDSATNRRANPGEDYQCRCEAIPILTALEAVA